MGTCIYFVFVSAIFLTVSLLLFVVPETDMLQIPNQSNTIQLPANESIEEEESGSIAGFKLIPEPAR